MPKDPDRRLDPDRTREAILQVARKLFSERGFHGTSMSQLAAMAGISQSLIHHHFGSKRALWNRIKEWYAEEYLRTVGVRVYNRADPVADLVHRLVDFIRDQPEFSRFAAWVEVENEPSVPRKALAAWRFIDAQLADAQQRALLRPDVPPAIVREIVAYLVLGWFRSLGMAGKISRRRSKSTGRDAAYIATVIELLRVALKPSIEPAKRISGKQRRRPSMPSSRRPR